MAGKIQQRNDRYLFLDSSGSSFSSDSRFYYVFPKSTDLGPPHSDIRCVVSSFQCFASQYNINSYNNVLRLIIGGTSRTVTVPPGQYGTVTLAAWLNGGSRD
jgi:hypothetical protein